MAVARRASTTSTKRGSTLQSKEEGKEDDRALLASLVETTSLGPAVKAVFDRGWQDSYKEFLDSSVKQKDAKIQQICNENYEEFINAVESLITVKLDIQNLKNSLVELNAGVQKSGKEVVECARYLMEDRRIRKRIEDTITVLRLFEDAMHLAEKAHSLIEAQKYISALKALEDLQRVHLPRIKEYDFAERLESQIPIMIKSIRESVGKDFEQWLTDMRNRSVDLGALAMAQLHAKMNPNKESPKEVKDKEKEKRGVDLTPVKAGQERTRLFTETTSSQSQDLDEAAILEAGPQGSIFEVNVAAAFQCLHICATLNIAEEFQALYRSKRKGQLTRAVDMPVSGKAVRQYLERIAGFFIIEDAVMKSGGGDDLMSRTELEALWEVSVVKLKTVLKDQLAAVSDSQTFLEVKYFVVLFCRVLSSYNIFVQPLYDFLANARDQFDQMMYASFEQQISAVVKDEKMEPLRVMNFAQYQQMVLAFQLQDTAVNVEYPATMPFSQFVPRVCAALRYFITEYSKFTTYLPHFDLNLFAVVDRALTQVVFAKMNEVLKDASRLQISQATQLSVNASYLADVCAESGWLFKETTRAMASLGGTTEVVELEDTGSKVREKGKEKLSGALGTYTLPARGKFDSIKSRCEHITMELIRAKVDQFLSLSSSGREGEWTPNVEKNVPSEWVQDAIVYLETTFLTLTFLPDTMREATHFTALNHIASEMKEMFFGVKKYNMLGVHSFHLDVWEMESFCARCSVANLAETFAELRQFVNLFLSGDLLTLGDKESLRRKYPLVDPGKLLPLCEHFKELEKSSRASDSLRALKKKDVDAFVKRLKKDMK